MIACSSTSTFFFSKTIKQKFPTFPDTLTGDADAIQAGYLRGRGPGRRFWGSRKKLSSYQQNGDWTISLWYFMMRLGCWFSLNLECCGHSLFFRDSSPQQVWDWDNLQTTYGDGDPFYFLICRNKDSAVNPIRSPLCSKHLKRTQWQPNIVSHQLPTIDLSEGWN